MTCAVLQVHVERPADQVLWGGCTFGDGLDTRPSHARLFYNRCKCGRGRGRLMQGKLEVVVVVVVVVSCAVLWLGQPASQHGGQLWAHVHMYAWHAHTHASTT